MTSVKRDYNELTQIIDEDIKRVKEMKNLIHEAVKSSQQKAQTLKDYEANEEKELLEKKRKLKERLDKVNHLIPESEKTLSQLKNSPISKQRQEQEAHLRELRELIKKEQEKHQLLLQKEKEANQKLNSDKMRKSEEEKKEVELSLKATQFELINRDNIVDLKFKCIDDNDPGKLFVCSIKLEESHFSVISCTDNIAGIQRVVDDYNKDADLYNFIKRVRRTFKEAVQGRNEFQRIY